jgi:ATP-dependent HslUV protease ATP-binding subunit HslU
MSPETSLTPRQIVLELDKYIVGQQAAKRAVAIALRNRWRRRRVPAALRDEIAPKNIILIGATGVGKTEIARRLAKLTQAPFMKIEASKFTEVGYVGRDVDSIIRDLVENAVQLVRAEAKVRVMQAAAQQAEERLLDLLLPLPAGEKNRPAGYSTVGAGAGFNSKTSAGTGTGTGTGTEAGAGNAAGAESAAAEAAAPPLSSRERLRQMLRDGTLASRQVEIDAEERRQPTLQMFPSSGVEEMGMNLQDMMGQMMGKRTRKRRVNMAEALELLTQEEAHKLIDDDAVTKEAVRRAEESGIVFLDEIDKIARREGSGSGPDVSREGVQRDILPIVEGSTVTTKYGSVKTDHMLFIAAGAFHVSKVSDLIPELQGRFPIQVELESLGEPELLRILKEPQNALPVQYTALLATEEVTLQFSAEGLQAVARLAAEANSRSENIGARRLHTVLEKLLEEISFAAPESPGKTLRVDAPFVAAALNGFMDSDDLTRYIL